MGCDKQHYLASCQLLLSFKNWNNKLVFNKQEETGHLLGPIFSGRLIHISPFSEHLGK